VESHAEPPMIEPLPEPAFVDPEPEVPAETDTFPSVEPTEEGLEEVETELEFDEVSPADLVYEEQEYSPALLEKEPEELVEGFSYDELLEGPAEFKSLIERFEHQISEGQNTLALVTARAAYNTLINELFPKEYFEEGNEASIMLTLNIKYRRYKRFRRLLDSEMIRTPDLLFLHHFLCDLYLSIREI
jgi:hypothetical protein